MLLHTPTPQRCSHWYPVLLLYAVTQSVNLFCYSGALLSAVIPYRYSIPFPVLRLWLRLRPGPGLWPGFLALGLELCLLPFTWALALQQGSRRRGWLGPGPLPPPPPFFLEVVPGVGICSHLGARGAGKLHFTSLRYRKFFELSSLVHILFLVGISPMHPTKRKQLVPYVAILP